MTFRAAMLWVFNLYGAVLVIPLAVSFFLVDVSNTLHGGGFSRLSASTLGLSAFSLISAILVYFPGNVRAMLPYAVEIKPGVGVALFAPFNNLFIPIEEILDIDTSGVWSGYAVSLKKRRGLLFQFYIPVFFGAKREPLAREIERMIDGRDAR
ncbi:MAG: hypothetical protein WBC04_19735 [Candidatus Acidiferrales bacterium]